MHAFLVFHRSGACYTRSVLHGKCKAIFECAWWSGWFKSLYLLYAFTVGGTAVLAQ